MSCRLMPLLWRVLSGTPPPATYTISGTVSGDVASGVTVTLSGDDSDSTTTAVDGTYSFTVPNGSYTVTPSLTDYTFSPANRAVTVSDGNQASKDFTSSYDYAVLPYTYDITSEVSETSGGVAAQLSDWTVITGLDDGEITTTVADSNSFTPSGVTKGFQIVYGASRDGYGLDLARYVRKTETGIRFAILAFAAQNNRWTYSILTDRTMAEYNAGSPNLTGKYGGVPQLSNSPDLTTTYSRYSSTTEYNEFNGENMGADVDSTRYHWLRYQYSFPADSVHASMYRAEDDTQIWSDSKTMGAQGAALDNFNDHIRSFYVIAAEGTSTVTLVRLWIGSLTDDWPSVAP